MTEQRAENQLTVNVKTETAKKGGNGLQKQQQNAGISSPSLFGGFSLLTGGGRREKTGFVGEL